MVDGCDVDQRSTACLDAVAGSIDTPSVSHRNRDHLPGFPAHQSATTTSSNVYSSNVTRYPLDYETIYGFNVVNVI